MWGGSTQERFGKVRRVTVQYRHKSSPYSNRQLCSVTPGRRAHNSMEGKVPILKRSCIEGLLKKPTQMYRSLLRSFWEALLSGTSWDAVPGRLQDVQQSTTNK